MGSSPGTAGFWGKGRKVKPLGADHLTEATTAASAAFKLLLITINDELSLLCHLYSAGILAGLSCHGKPMSVRIGETFFFLERERIY